TSSGRSSTCWWPRSGIWRRLADCSPAPTTADSNPGCGRCAASNTGSGRLRRADPGDLTNGIDNLACPNLAQCDNARDITVDLVTLRDHTYLRVTHVVDVTNVMNEVFGACEEHVTQCVSELLVDLRRTSEIRLR